MAELIVGIDLGTTNSEVAVLREGQPVVLAAADGRRILPSFVGFDDDGALLVGEPARNQYVVHPERTVKSIKRRMGEEVRIPLGAAEYTPQELSAIILRRLKEVAEAALGQAVHKAVITVPAYFSDAQRQATREAGQIAGLEVVRMINEPTAAALAYEAGHRGSRTVLVYDLGGGTFDVSVVRIEDDVVEVIASHGNNRLGGDDFDLKIVERLLKELRERQGVELPPASGAMARLLRAAETAKVTLSDHPFALIEEEYLTGGESPVHLSLELSRDDYEAMIEPFVEETLEAVHTALHGAGLAASRIEEILLVGGSTRTPLVRRHLVEVFGKTPRGEVDPELCVALGAAIQGAVIGGAAGTAVLVDVTPYTFGTSAMGELDGEWTISKYVPIIHKNTPVPVSRSEVFFTAVDEQEQVEVLVYQGEHPDALDNIEIGRFLVEGLGKAPAGNPIVARFDLDLDGVLQVSAREKLTGLERRITIDNAISRFEHDEMVRAQQRVASLFGSNDDESGAVVPGGAEVEHRREVVEARALVEKAERLLDQAPPEDRDEMVDLIEAIHDALAAGDWAGLAEPREQLADILFYLES